MLSIKIVVFFFKLKPSEDAAEETSLLRISQNRIKVLNGVQKKDKTQTFADEHTPFSTAAGTWLHFKQRQCKSSSEEAKKSQNMAS